MYLLIFYSWCFFNIVLKKRKIIFLAFGIVAKKYRLHLQSDNQLPVNFTLKVWDGLINDFCYTLYFHF